VKRLGATGPLIDAAVRNRGVKAVVAFNPETACFSKKLGAL
jgi:hypothetical protein